MEFKEEDCSSDISDEINVTPMTKRQLNFAIISSEEERISSDSTITTDSHNFPTEHILSASESEDNGSNHNDISDKGWSDPIGNLVHLIPFTGRPGLKLLDESCTKVEDFYRLLVTEEIFERIAEQTNLYAGQILNQKQSTRLNEWTHTDKNEIKRFFGLIMWMGLVKLPKLHLYWSKDPAFGQSFPRSIMPRNRFELILRVLHFANNEERNSTHCLYKIGTIIEALNENFQKYYDPGEILCIDESLMGYMGQKRHKYNIKIFKLCSAPGYTTTFQIYCSKWSDAQKISPTNIVMSLCENIFGKSHTLYTDKWFTSVDLSQKLLAANTYLVGIVRPNCRGISKEVVNKKLNRGELFAKEHKSGLTLLKWKDKCDVLLLTTKHSTETVTITKRARNYIRPKVVVDYNKGKSLVNKSDQMAAYSSPLRKSVKWYKKLVFELLLNISVVNAWIMYKAKHGSISIIEFKKQLAMYLTHCQDEVIKSYDSHTVIITKRKRHEMRKKEGKALNTRRRCSLCYMRNVEKFGTQRARNCTVRVVTFCDDCPDKPYFCLPCFNIKHRFMPF